MDESKTKFCCEKCFNDDFLTDYLRSHGEPETCTFCDEKSNYCLRPEDLRELFSPLVNLYEPRENFMPTEQMKEEDGSFIWEVLNDQWGLFNFGNKAEELVKSIMGPDLHIYDSWVENEEEYFGQSLDISADLKESWYKLRDDLKHKNRFFNSELNDLMDYLYFLNRTIKKGEKFYRARKCDGKELMPIEMGRPPEDMASAGRGNPEGISYLYLASDAITAVSEIKPYIHQYITVGTFDLKNDLKIIDLRIDKLFSPFRYGKSLSAAMNARSLFYLLGEELSKPIEPQSKNASLEYLPTQYLCELIKKNAHDGVLYKSTLGTGFNILLFSESDTVCVKTELIKVKEISYSIQ